MSGSRRVVSLSTVVVAVGSMAALGAFFLDPARAAVGPIPGEALILPASSTFLMGVDVRRLTSSTFYQKYGRHGGAGRPDTFGDLEEKTGLNPERDLDRIVVAGGSGEGVHRSTVALVSGRFDRYKIGRSIETGKKDVTTKNYHGVTEYLFGEGSKAPGALAFLDDQTLVVGTQTLVEATIENFTGGGATIKQNTTLMDLAAQVKPGSTFWMVGDKSLLANLPGNVPAPGSAPGSGSMLQLPALQSLTVTGEVEPNVSFEAVGEASDEAAAKNLGDVVRGFTALAALQANQKPELKDLASAINVTNEGNHVRVSGRFPLELLDALSPAGHKTAEAAKAPAVQIH